MIALANLSIEHERIVEERDKYKREADTLTETLQITQARCTELVMELREVKTFFDSAYVDSLVVRRRIACDIERVLVGGGDSSCHVDLVRRCECGRNVV